MKLKPLNFDLFSSEVARLAMTLPLAATFARHAYPHGPLDYFHPECAETRAAGWFLADLATMRTEWILKKWFKPGAMEMMRKADNKNRTLRLDKVMRVPKSATEMCIPHPPFRNLK